MQVPHLSNFIDLVDRITCVHMRSPLFTSYQDVWHKVLRLCSLSWCDFVYLRFRFGQRNHAQGLQGRRLIDSTHPVLVWLFGMRMVLVMTRNLQRVSQATHHALGISQKLSPNWGDGPVWKPSAFVARVYLCSTCRVWPLERYSRCDTLWYRAANPPSEATASLRARDAASIVPVHQNSLPSGKSAFTWCTKDLRRHK